MTLNITIPTSQKLTPRITIMGVGGGGGSAINSMIDFGLGGVEFVAANTDVQALALSKAPTNIQLGEVATQGLGAGADPEVGLQAAKETEAEILNCIKDSHMLFLTAGMGGGTGTGAMPAIARMARENKILTVGVVTMPFLFEGSHRMAAAKRGIGELKQYTDTLIIVPNQNLFRVANEKTCFVDAFSMTDQVLYAGIAGIADLMTKPGRINLDFADVRTIMQNMGKAMMGTGSAAIDKDGHATSVALAFTQTAAQATPQATASDATSDVTSSSTADDHGPDDILADTPQDTVNPEGKSRALLAAENAIANPLLEEASIKGAKGVLINITGGDDVTLYEVEEVTQRICEEMGPNANVIVGSAFDASMEGTLKVLVVATGLSEPATQALHAGDEQDMEGQNVFDASATISAWRPASQHKGGAQEDMLPRHNAARPMPHLVEKDSPARHEDASAPWQAANSAIHEENDGSGQDGSGQEDKVPDFLYAKPQKSSGQQKKHGMFRRLKQTLLGKVEEWGQAEDDAMPELLREKTNPMVQAQKKAKARLMSAHPSVPAERQDKQPEDASENGGDLSLAESFLALENSPQPPTASSEQQREIPAFLRRKIR